MKRGTTRQFIALACLVTSLGTAGCGTLFDITYLIGSKRYNESKEERKPTGQVNTAIEYDSALAPDGQIRVTCEERERRIERTFSVSKTYEYRGGYTRSQYVAASILSAVAGGAVAGIIAIGCNLPVQPGEKDAKRWSCVNALYATPFAVDMGYSIIRAVTAKTPKLVDKQKNEGAIAYSTVPTRTNTVSCDSIDRVVLGNAYGSSDLESPNTDSGEGERLVNGSIPVAREADGSIKLLSQPDVVNAWVKNPGLQFLVVNREGKPRALNIDRCAALRPTVSVMQPAEQSMFFRACPMPAATAPR